MNNPKSLTPRQRRKLEERYHELSQHKDLHDQKQAKIERALIIEAGASIKFQLEQELLDVKAQRQKVEVEQDEIEQISQQPPQNEF